MLTQDWSRFCPHKKKKEKKNPQRTAFFSKFSAASLLSIFVASCSFLRYTKYTNKKTFFSVQVCFIALLPVTYLGSVGICWSLRSAKYCIKTTYCMNSFFTDIYIYTYIHTYLSISLYWWEYFLVKNQKDNLPSCGPIETSHRIYLVTLKLSLKVRQLCWFHSLLELLSSLGSPNCWLPCQLLFCSADLLAETLASLGTSDLRRSTYTGCLLNKLSKTKLYLGNHQAYKPEQPVLAF